MSEDELQRDVLAHVAMDRRSFAKKAIGGAFALPIIASFAMKNADIASANALGANQNPVPPASPGRDFGQSVASTAQQGIRPPVSPPPASP